MTEEQRRAPGKSYARRLIGSGAVVVATGAVIFSSTALLGVNDKTSTQAFVPPGMRCDSPISCTEPVGTVQPPSPAKLFIEGKAHDLKALAAGTLAPSSATAEHVPGSSTKNGCGCPVCCAASDGKGAIIEARQLQDEQILLDVIEADGSTSDTTARPVAGPKGRGDRE